MSQDLNNTPPLSRQVLLQLDWLTQIWATGAAPSAPVQATLDHLAQFRRWSAHRWSLKHPRLRAHRWVADCLARKLGEQQFAVLIELMDAAAQIPSNGSAEELGIALRYLNALEQCALTQNVTQQWQSQPRFCMLLKLVAQVPGRSQLPAPDDIRSHLNSLFREPNPQIQAMSLFLLHQFSLTEGKAQATHLLSRRLQLEPLLAQVARAIVNAPEEAVDIEDCPALLELLAQELEAADLASLNPPSTAPTPTDEPTPGPDAATPEAKTLERNNETEEDQAPDKSRDDDATDEPEFPNSDNGRRS